MVPLRTTQLKGLGGGGPPSAATAGGSTGAHTNSYVMLVGLRMKKRLVLRTRTPSDSNSTTCKVRVHVRVHQKPWRVCQSSCAGSLLWVLCQSRQAVPGWMTGSTVRAAHLGGGVQQLKDS